MAAGKFIAYYRVSTVRQGLSGLGLEAQRQAVRDYLNGGDWSLLREFTEVESGGKNDRPQLAAAMAECRLTGATLIIAKLDRLSRNAAFLIGLRDAGVSFVAADMPNANALTVGILALVAENERDAISARTKAALAAARARGTVLGGSRGAPAPDWRKSVQARQDRARDYARAVLPVIIEMRERGLSLRGCVAELKDRGVRTPRGGAWTAGLVSRLLTPD